MVENNYKKIAFQGAIGAYSDLACRTAFPDLETVPCNSFYAAFTAVQNGEADLAMIPVDNTLAGRVADVHNLMPKGGLHIIAEHFQPIHHSLLALPGSKKENLKDVYSHIHALPQCRDFIRQMGLKEHVHSDTAAAAAYVRDTGDKTKCAISSELAAEIYGLEILEHNIQDADHNTTRFLVLTKESDIPPRKNGDDYLTSFVFEVRNIPAALYKALGGFATNGVQMVKLESYVDKHFNVARFYADVEGHPEDRSLALALEELNFFGKHVVMLGTYKAHPFRKSKA